MKLFVRFFTVILVFHVCASGIAQRGIKWTPDGTAYYTNEKGVLVKYQLPSFDKTELIQPAQLTPAGKDRPLPVRDFFFSNDGKTVLIYTNTKRVWRLDTRGDYWILNTATNTLRQLGKGKPASALMFAKISPDGLNVAYEANIISMSRKSLPEKSRH